MGFLSGKPKDWQFTRGERFFNERGVWPALPELSEGEYLFDDFMTLGVYSPPADGNLYPLSWSEIQAYRACSSRLTTYWECCMMREMSKAYLMGRVTGNDVFGIYPEE